jgi:hypothetical protein
VTRACELKEGGGDIAFSFNTMNTSLLLALKLADPDSRQTGIAANAALPTVQRSGLE